MNIRNKNLLKACESLEKLRNTEDKWRPKFHLSPVTGWLNDPNGLCEFMGKYHIFFQYSPFDTKTGLNYWGHYSTENFIDYEYHAPALCCDEQFDCHGVYSGSAVVKDNKLYIFYTGNVKHLGNYDYILSGREHNTVRAESLDGIIFENKTIIFRNSDYPENVTLHVRDPKVYKYKDKYIMILGARTKENKGEILIYISDDLDVWNFSGIIDSWKDYGYMWECPDLIDINGKLFLVFSPQGIESDGILYNNIYQSGYSVITGNFPENCKTGEFTELDRGFDFYAPQTFVDSGGRRILIGWAGLPDIDKLYSNPTEKYGWVHCLTVPREITEKNGKLIQNPVRELEKMRSEQKYFSISGYFGIDTPDIFECEINILENQGFVMECQKSFKLKYHNNILTLSMNKNGYGRKERSVVLDRLDNIHILCDTSVAEIYINHGEEVFTARYYPEIDDRGIDIHNISGNITLWNLRGFNII